MTASETTTFRSILDKPLNKLTEDDISQLTREDCRKYLKDKGMRRPSWNKSQAIQQVISLKAMLEPCDDSGAGALRNIVSSPPQNIPRVNKISAHCGRETSGIGLVSVSPEESVVHLGKEPSKSAFQERPTDTDNNIISPRSQSGTDNSIGQLTIFYCGRVNVYDGVPPDKARAIMHLAESSIHFSESTSAVGSFAWHSQTASDKGGIPPIASISQPIHKGDDCLVSNLQLRSLNILNTARRKETKLVIVECLVKQPAEILCLLRDSDVIIFEALPLKKFLIVDMDILLSISVLKILGGSSQDADGQASRKVSLQRYLEKRKDRGRIKIKKHSGVSSSLDVYLNHQLRTTTSNCTRSRSTNSPPESGLPQSFSCTADNQPRVTGFPVDLNEMFSSAELETGRVVN